MIVGNNVVNRGLLPFLGFLGMNENDLLNYGRIEQKKFLIHAS